MSELFPYAGSGPGGERLIAGLTLLEKAGQAVPVDEAIVTMAMEPTWMTGFDDPVSINSAFVGLLRTAGYFILDSDQVKDALASEPPVGIPAFPPLPFRRIWIETHVRKDRYEIPATYLRWVREERMQYEVRMPEETVEVFGIGIIEATPLRKWDVFVPFQLIRQSGARSGLKVAAYQITPTEILQPQIEYVAADVALRNLLMMSINGAHLITAKNVPHKEITIPRPQRRRMQREQRVPSIPKMYYVSLETSGEMSDVPTHREYHCRWLVMGHWRHIPNGLQMCTCYHHRFNPKPATWIDSYVKGPVGAPWKGRPVHRSAT